MLRPATATAEEGDYVYLFDMATSVRLPPGIEKRLAALAAKTGRSKAFYVREMIVTGIEDAEDRYLGMQVFERVRRGKERVFSLDEVEKKLGPER